MILAMINISTSKQLGIVLPNTNKALAQVLSNASPQELEVISQGKDLKSVMNTILKRSGADSSTDKELLRLVKNNPTLKNLGDVSSTIKDLLNSITPAVKREMTWEMKQTVLAQAMTRKRTRESVFEQAFLSSYK